MWRRVIFPGLSGGLAMIVFAFVVNGILGFRSSIDMKTTPDERVIHEALKERVTEPGRYVVNPAPTGEGRFPEGEPVYTILYGGVGHEAAGGMMLRQMAVTLFLPILAVWMLSRSGGRVRGSYSRRLGFFVSVGLIVGLSGHLMDAGIGGYPVSDAILLTLHDIVLWTVAGLVMARAMASEPAA